MRIVNMTGMEIECKIDEKLFLLEHGKNIELATFEVMKIFHRYTCYSIHEANKSKLLKFLGKFDDPFKLKKEYYIVVDFEMNEDQIYNSQQAIITSEKAYVDYKTRTYYEYFVVKCDGKQMSPSRVYISGGENIKADFEENSRKLTRWNAVWDLFIEPVLLDAIGYLLVGAVFSIWFGKLAWFFVLSLATLSVFIELVRFVCKLKKEPKPIQQFCHYLDEHVVKEVCYNKAEEI